jgi:hypothetical protein
MRRRGVFGKSSGGYGGITHALRQSDIWAAAACHSGDMGFELCYLPDMPAVLRSLAGAENSIERWWQQLEAAKKHSEGSGRVVNALAMAASYDPDPPQLLRIPGHLRYMRSYRGTLRPSTASRTVTSVNHLPPGTAMLVTPARSTRPIACAAQRVQNSLSKCISRWVAHPGEARCGNARR